MRVLLIDNYDSFTYMLADYLQQCDLECVVCRNDEPLLLKVNPNSFDALVISPGPETPIEAGFLMQVLPDFIGKIPILGVCLGHQALGLHFGALLEKAQIPRHGKVDLHKHLGNSLFEGVPEKFLATRYHSLILKNLPANLEAICYSGDELMGFVHVGLPIWGLQFHPESCETAHGLQMIKNFIEMAKKIAQN